MNPLFGLVVGIFAAVAFIGFINEQPRHHQHGHQNYNRTTNNYRPVPQRASGNERRNRPKQKRLVIRYFVTYLL